MLCSEIGGLKLPSNSRCTAAGDVQGYGAALAVVLSASAVTGVDAPSMVICGTSMTGPLSILLLWSWGVFLQYSRLPDHNLFAQTLW